MMCDEMNKYFRPTLHDLGPGLVSCWLILLLFKTFMQETPQASPDAKF
jgi:hypothetical protein